MAKEKKTIEERMKSLDGVLSGIRKEFGKESVMVLGDEPREQLERVSTGSLLLDEAIGGGYVKGRIIEIAGPNSSGKSTLALHATAECQKAGGICAYIDSEHAMDLQYAENLGVDTSNLIFSQPDSGEQGLGIVEDLVKSNEIALVVVDSVATLTPQAELDGEMGASHMGLQARLMGQALRKLTGVISKSNTIVIFINQYRMKLISYGNPETTCVTPDTEVTIEL